ncbi:hypothetical protein IO401_001182, partial [Campylobacter lari]|nr:hypothetical protein [Campylobacter lari]
MVNGNNTNNVTINNQGAISGGHGIKTDGSGTIGNVVVESINNTGSISGSWNGISIERASTIKNINNSGTISSSNNQDNSSIFIAGGNSKVETITNTGTIGTDTSRWGIKINESTVNFIDNKNSGYIRGIQVNQNGTIKTLNNSGIIGAHGVQVNGGSSKIENLTNNKGGQILGAGNGIQVNGKATINTIINNGFIRGEGFAGIRIGNQGNKSTIQQISNNGTIRGDKSGIYVEDSIVDHISNSGTIITDKSNLESGGNGFYYNNGGGIFVFRVGKVKTIENSGLILTSNSGIGVHGNANTNGANIETISNSGTIQYTGSFDASGKVYGTGAGIYMGNLNGVPVVNTIKNSGLIDTINGMYFSLGTQVKTIENSGTILARQDGIVLGNDHTSTKDRQTKIDYINNSGLIYASRYGIFLDTASNPKVPFQIGTIVSSGSIIGHSKNGIGIFLKEKSKINDYIKLEGKNALIAGGSAGIHNNGTIGVNNNESSVNNGNVIDLQDGATIAALSPNKNGSFSYNTEGNAILNNGLIKGNINLDGGSNIYGLINNSAGTIQGNIALNDKSNIFGGINNSKTITGNISLNNKSNIVGVVRNNENGVIQGSIDLKEKSHIDNIINSGTIVGGIKLDDSTIGSITNNKGGKADLELKNNSVVGTITNNGDMEITRD